MSNEVLFIVIVSVVALVIATMMASLGFWVAGKIDERKNKKKINNKKQSCYGNKP